MAYRASRHEAVGDTQHFGISDHAKSELLIVYGTHGRRGFRFLFSLTSIPLFPADVTEHVRMDVQADIGHVVKVLAGHKPDDLADLAFRIMAGHASKSVRVNLLILGQLRHIVQCRTL